MCVGGGGGGEAIREGQRKTERKNWSSKHVFSWTWYVKACDIVKRLTSITVIGEILCMRLNLVYFVLLAKTTKLSCTRKTMHVYWCFGHRHPIPTRLLCAPITRGGGGAQCAPPLQNHVPLLRIHSKKVFLKACQKMSLLTPRWFPWKPWLVFLRWFIGF